MFFANLFVNQPVRKKNNKHGENVMWMFVLAGGVDFVAGDGWDDFDLEDSKPKVAEIAGATSAQVCRHGGFVLKHACLDLLNIFFSIGI